MSSFRNVFVFWLVAVFGLGSSMGFSFESTRVLPQGRSTVNIRTMHLSFDSWATSQGSIANLGAPFNRGLTLKDAARQKGLDLGAWAETKSKAFLAAHAWSEDTVLGSFEGESEARVDAFVTMYGYGITSWLTFGIAVPYLEAKTATQISFLRSGEADAFTGYLAANGRTREANLAVASLNDAQRTFHSRLSEKGLNVPESWEASGVGDVILQGKALVLQSGAHSFATEVGAKLPSGKTENPAVLTDIPLGSGTTDWRLAALYDYSLGDGLVWNGGGRYIFRPQVKRELAVREIGSLDPSGIEAVSYDVGDEHQLFTSLQYEARFGFLVGFGYDVAIRKGDRFATSAYEPLSQSHRGSRQYAWQSRIGYGTVQKFLRGEVSVPFASTLSFKHQTVAQNIQAADQIQFDLNLYF